MHCSNCKITVADDASFCPICGTSFLPPGEPATPPNEVAVTPLLEVAVAPSFRDPTRLTGWLSYFLMACVIIDAGALLSDVLQYQLLSDFKLGVFPSEEAADAAAESSDLRQAILGGLQAIVGIATVVLFSMWIYRANFNARALGAQNMKFTPGWSVGYFFVPILWFWKPYQAMKEIWQANKAPGSWESIERGAILPWWWLLFLVSSMLGNAAFRTSLQAKGIEALQQSTGFAIASDAVSIPAALVALFLVRQVHQMQMAHVNGRG